MIELRGIARPLAAALLALGAGSIAGCNIIAPAFVLIHGPPKIDAAYELDEKRPTVIFVDDLANKVPRRSLRLKLAGQAEKDLLAEGALKDMIRAQDAMAASSTDRSTKPMAVSQIGRAVGAEVVIYAAVEEFTLSADRQTYAPYARLRVKVIDAVSDTRLWPPEGDGAPIEVRTDLRQGSPPATLSQQNMAEDELAVIAGNSLAQLFYRHETPRSVQTAD